MKLQELLKTVYEYKMAPSGNNGNIYAVFTTNAGEEVEVLFSFRRPYGMYGIDFTRGGRYAMTGGGDALRIFGTIMAIIDQFVREQDPRGLFFAAHKTEASRVALYNRLIKRYTADGQYVDVTDSLDRLKDENTREWFEMKLDDGDRPDEQKLIVKKEELK